MEPYYIRQQSDIDYLYDNGFISLNEKNDLYDGLAMYNDIVSGNYFRREYEREYAETKKKMVVMIARHLIGGVTGLFTDDD